MFGATVKPTRAHYFYAQNWLARLWIVIIPALFVVLMAGALGPPPEISGLNADAKAYLFLLGISLLFGICVAALLGPFILGPLYHHRAELNGYPYRPGDFVEILVGPSRGRVARVVEVWDWRGNLRIDLGEVARPKSKTLFTFTEVIKRSDAEPPVAADAPQASRR
jgi:hypothetical protein